MSLEEIKVRLLSATETTEDLLAQVNDIYFQEVSSEDNFLEEALKQLHNSGEIQFVELVKNVDKNSCRYDFFIILRAFENVLPSLEASVEDVIHCLVHLTQLCGRDFAIGGLYSAYERFCSREISRSKGSIEIILGQSELNTYASFIASSILAYHSDHMAEAIQIAESFIDHKNDIVRRQAYFTLGSLKVNESQANTIWKLLIGSIYREHDSDCCITILKTALNFGKKFPSYWQQIEELLNILIENASPNVQDEISRIIAFQVIELPENVIKLLVKKLKNVSPENKLIIDNIDHVLVKLLDKYSHSIAIELLESVLSVGVSFQNLDYFAAELLKKNKEFINNISTKWFISGEPSLCRSVLDILNNATDEEIELKAEMALLDDEIKQVFAIHKAVGWLFTRPISAASFILSIYETASMTTRKEIERILYDPLLLSYPGELNRFFLSCIERGNQEQLCEHLIRKLNIYHADLEKVSGLKELMPPSENVSAYWKNFDKSMQEAYEEAPKSPLMSLFTTQRLLYGNTSIYYVHQGNGEQIRQEMEMQSFSHSTEMPRLNILDPESLDHILRVYRIERMKNEVNS
ncbi:hypothetical protein [Pectobacterium sp. 21LCBS03]|uniref:hypothetical protein n=1 Tax=Pectobacterium sp. 21LCBS03 TaxID=2935858 RepID=UPI00200E3B0D|nr:hypothetical protein [Pectobacterium sp. 21LCBS03]UPY96280.1 hypothetical protein MYB54_06115 [Pectobacterium sp. 21LCBS03]